MKNIQITFYKTFQTVVLILALTCTASINAQPSFDDDVKDGIPLDGGLSLLAIGAAAYGMKKLRSAKK